MEDKDIHLHDFLDQPAEPVKSRSPEATAEGGSPERAGGEASLAPQSEADKKPTEPKDLLPPAADPDPKKPVKKPSTAPRRVLLSKLLKSVPESECVHIFQNWDAAIVEETIRAVPFKGREFSKEIIDLKGKKALIE